MFYKRLNNLLAIERFWGHKKNRREHGADWATTQVFTYASFTGSLDFS
jgi:hypothetical protein